jgi:hypothetical protein
MIRFCLITILALLSLTSFAWSQQAPTAQDYMQAAQDALQENDTTTAIQDYLLAIRIDPKNWQAYQNLGGCYIQIRKMGDAKAAYDMSLTINPNNPELRKFVAQVFGGPTATPTFELMAIPTATSTPMIYNPAFATPTSTPGFVGRLVNTSTPNFTPTATPTFFGILANTSTPTPAPTKKVEVVIPPFIDVMTPTIPRNGEHAPIHFKGFKPYVYQGLARYNLPEKNTLTLDLGGAVWFGSIQNFNDFFGPNLVPAASSHTGWEFDGGADYAIVNEFQLGLHLEGLASPVTRSQLGSQFVEWDSYAVGGALAAKYLIPLNSAMSLVFHIEGGYYTLVASQIKYDNGAQGEIALGGSTIGGLGEAQLELFQVADKSLALDFGLGYRMLKFGSITGTGTNGLTGSGQLLNADGTPAYADYSGPRISMSIRFVH